MALDKRLTGKELFELGFNMLVRESVTDPGTFQESFTEPEFGADIDKMLKVLLHEDSEYQSLEIQTDHVGRRGDHQLHKIYYRYI